jgi:hypothetical protein
LVFARPENTLTNSWQILGRQRGGAVTFGPIATGTGGSSDIIGYVMQFFGLELLSMARDLAGLNLPARVGGFSGVSL